MTVTMKTLTKELGGHPKPLLGNTSTLPPAYRSCKSQKRPSCNRSHRRRPYLQSRNGKKYYPALLSRQLSTLKVRGTLPLS